MVEGHVVERHLHPLTRGEGQAVAFQLGTTGSEATERTPST